VNKFGDPDAVLGRASVVINAEYEAPFLSHATMEPMNCTASFKDGKVEIWSPTQFPDWATGATAGALKILGTSVTVHVTLMGGGFGRRINPDFTVEAALISKAAGKAVKVVWNRSDDLRHDFYRPCAMHRFDASLGADGFPEAWRHRLANPAIGAFYQGPKPGHGKDEADGSENMAYRIPNRSVEYTLIESGVPRGWWRAVSTTHAVFAVESFIDELAAIAGKDPVEYRLALIDQIPGVKPDPASADFAFVPERLKGVLRTAAEKAGWGKPLPAGHAMGIACGRDHRSYAAEVVEVARVDGGVRIVKVVCAADCGPVMNPTGARAQLEGGIIMALSAATKEAITIAGGAVEQTGFDRYPLLRMNEAPPVIETHFVETDMHPTGLGEPSVPPLAPALANAITKLTGKRPRSMPFPVG
jgi:isoquinoline 1-oxidoreductase beta subunit